MENTAFDGDVDKTNMELTDVKVHKNHDAGQHLCAPDVCRAVHAKYLQDKSKMAVNPWDRLKSLFLVGIIGLLVLWLVVYVASSRMGLV